MRAALVWIVVLGAAAVTAATEFIVFGMVGPPGAGSALLGGLWLAMPFLASAGLALLFRRRPAPLVALLASTAVAAALGLCLFGNAAHQKAEADRQAENAVLPGEDPSHGPAAMRKSGAEIGQGITGVFSILFAVFVPPVQLGVVAVPPLIAWGAAAVAGRKGPGGRREGQVSDATSGGQPSR